MARQTDSLAVLFADLNDSARSREKVGDSTAFSQVRSWMTVLADAAQRHHGHVVKTIGECAMFAFDSADDAAQAAIEMQDRIHLQPAARGRSKATIRIGFHYGPVLRDSSDVFGDTVNTAARMSDLAVPGQILLTATTADTLSHALQPKLRRLDTLAVKGKAEAVDVHELQWQDSGAVTVPPGPERPLARLAEPRLILVHDGREIECRTAMTIGRDPQHDIVVADPMASRNHARIEKRLDKFVLVDQSANGTYVTIGGRDEIVLRREEFIFYGSGSIAFGESSRRDPAVTLVEFRHESPEAPPGGSE